MAKLLERFFLKYSPALSSLRRVPGLGTVAHRLSHSVLPPERLIWVQVSQGAGKGLWLQLHPRTGQDCYNGRMEPPLQRVLEKHIRPGMVCYDLGANIGFFTLLAARLVGANGRVYSFEADPEVARHLQEHVNRNEFLNVRIINRAIWSSTGSVTFGRSDETQSPDRGWGKVVVPQVACDQAIQVPCIALEDFIRTEPHPDFIKCDVEGAESEVLMAAREMMSRHRPLVACEVHSDQNAVRLEQFFKELNYSLDWFSQHHFLASP